MDWFKVSISSSSCVFIDTSWACKFNHICVPRPLTEWAIWRSINCTHHGRFGMTRRQSKFTQRIFKRKFGKLRPLIAWKAFGNCTAPWRVRLQRWTCIIMRSSHSNCAVFRLLRSTKRCKLSCVPRRCSPHVGIIPWRWLLDIPCSKTFWKPRQVLGRSADGNDRRTVSGWECCWCRSVDSIERLFALPLDQWPLPTFRHRKWISQHFKYYSRFNTRI